MKTRSVLLVPTLLLILAGCSDKVCVYEQPRGQFCAVMDSCKDGATHDLVDGDDADSNMAGKKTCESLGFDCSMGYAKGRACSK